MEDLQHLLRELVRGILQRAEDVEAGPADPEHVADKGDKFIQAVGLISALANQDMDGRVTAGS